MFTTGAVDAHKHRSGHESALDGIYVRAYGYVVFVVGVEPVSFCNHLPADEWSACFDFRGPYAFHRILDLPEHLLEFLDSCPSFHHGLYRREVKDDSRSPVISVMHHIRMVVKIAVCSECHVAEGIMIWSIMPLRAIEPAVPAAHVPLVEGHHVVVQKISRTASS